MNISRRGFLAGLVGAAAGVTALEALVAPSPTLLGMDTSRVASTTFVFRSDIFSGGAPLEGYVSDGPFVSETPAFLTNYMDPRILDILLTPSEFEQLELFA